MVMSALNRRTLKDIPYYPDPEEIYQTIITSKGWLYKTRKEYYKIRDQALIALLYLIGARVSEVIRLTRDQFKDRETYIHVQRIKLSKSRKGKKRRVQYREANLPLQGERSQLTQLVIKYLQLLKPKERLFKFTLRKNEWQQIIGTRRVWQIVNAYMPEITTHWLRAFCENYLYGKWEHDILAVSDYVKVDARTLQQYIRLRYIKYPVV